MSRIRGRKPTYEERKALTLQGYSTYDWFVTKHTPTVIEIVNRNTGEVQTISIYTELKELRSVKQA